MSNAADILCPEKILKALVLQRILLPFVGVFVLREEIALFIAIKENNVPELGDPIFIANLAFLIDHLNMLNLSFQVPKPVITAIYDCVKSFKTNCLFGQSSYQIVT